LISLLQSKSSNIFELFSIFVARFFTRNVSRAQWVAKDGACAEHRDPLRRAHALRVRMTRAAAGRASVHRLARRFAAHVVVLVVTPEWACIHARPRRNTAVL